MRVLRKPSLRQTPSEPVSTQIPEKPPDSSVPEGETLAFVSPDSANGLERLVGGDADVEVVSVGEEKSWRTGNGRILPSPDGNQVPDFYMIIDVDDGFMYQSDPTSEVRIEIEYLDEGTDRFRIEYDAVSGGPFGDGRFKESEWVEKTNSGEYKIAAFELDDAYFANRIQGGDFRLNDDSEGFETIRSVRVILPSLLEVLTAEEYFLESELAFGQDKPDEAMEAIDRAIELDPENPEFRALRARLFWEVFKNVEKARSDYDFVVENSDPNDPGPYNIRGLFFLQSDQFELCVEDYTKFVELDPGNPWARLERGDC